MKVKQRFPWIQVSAAAAVLVVGVAAWLQIPVPTPAPKADTPMPVLGFVRLDPAAHAEVMAEQLAAYDPSPLFLPTAMSSGQRTLFLAEKNNLDGPFSTLPAQLVFPKDKANLVFKPIVELPSGPVQGLALTDSRAFNLVMGRTDGAGEALVSRAGYLEVARSGDGQVVLSLSLAETTNRPQGDWQPMELQGAVSRFGLLGGLVVTVSSGSDVIDDYFSAQLTRTLRVGERLPSGFYTFRMGP